MPSKIDRARSLLAELLVVFVGVLIALAADSWLQTRVDVERTTSYLRGIAEDMDSAASRLDPSITRMELEVERIGAGLDLLRTDGALPDTAVAPTMFNGGIAGVPMGTLHALVSTGDLELVRDDELGGTLVSEHARLQAGLAAAEQGSVKISSNVDRRIVAEEYLRRELGLSVGAPIPLGAARTSPELLASYRIHLGAMRIRLGQFRQIRESVEEVERGVRQVLLER